jgi:hypothetical protein
MKIRSEPLSDPAKNFLEGLDLIDARVLLVPSKGPIRSGVAVTVGIRVGVESPSTVAVLETGGTEIMVEPMTPKPEEAVPEGVVLGETVLVETVFVTDFEIEFLTLLEEEVFLQELLDIVVVECFVLELVGAGVERQEQADEILEGEPEHMEK